MTEIKNKRVATRRKSWKMSDPQQEGHKKSSQASEAVYAPWGVEKKVEPKLSCEILTINDSNDPSYTNLDLP